MFIFTDENEIKKRKELCELIQDWKNVIKTKEKILFPDDGKKYDAIDYFNSDGFFPGYFSSKQKVLFIGRESRWNSGNDRVHSDIKWLKNNSPNTSSYWRRILYIVYGIKTNGEYEYSQIPHANEIIDEMIEKNDFGFALMNISKYSNDSESGANADYDLINQFIEDSELYKRNFIREEIELLDPDVIITANLWNGKINEQYLGNVFPENDISFLKLIDGTASLSILKLNSKTIKLIDLYHFSSRGSDSELFYKPVMNFLFEK